MERIAHRELRNSSGDVLRRVQTGESFEVTNHGTVVAMIVPVAGAPSTLPVRPARIHGSFSELLAGLDRVHDDSMVVLDGLRDDR